MKNLSPKKYLNVIRPYSRDLINDHKPIMELNYNSNIIIVIIIIEQNGKFNNKKKNFCQRF